ncbi:MAG: YihA family ribosome biogenesis GTP-binding protein [Lentisphaerae bacterium]|nr:YihA family ribosome biogenesis GTP-binding protein [Lentisphaerota bacterium]MCP4100236.1 YihA family ribosome biogenesis GTP-binding protein [Lentisphaerota bacterium]
MTIKTSNFEMGAVSTKQFPNDNLPEFAFAGRSNVGKSSLINCLVNRNGLARSSSTPGKTREINFFLINEAFRFVDLPGFGYAKVAKQEQAKWQAYIDSYLCSKRNIRGVIHLVDSRHPGLDNDLMMAEFIKHTNLRCILVANKVDKLKKNQIQKNKAQMTKIFGQEPIMFSTSSKLGKSQLWSTIEEWMKN